ncbi:MAG: hypothetical protein KF732_12385 [Flavobacteriales bacterium]|nr:hypothetical protein [Flavobacteriales bacterium]
MKGLLKILGITILLGLFFAALGLVIWQWNIQKVYDNQKIEVTQIIDSKIDEEANKGMLLPKVVFINVDSSNQKQLSDSLLIEIKTFLTDKFVYDKNVSYKDLEIKPYYILPNKPNKNGQYLLTEEQLQELREHIDFLTKQVSIEVDRTKEEVGRDIDRLNTWVSIWIGVIGFLGIFVPIVINIDTAKSASEAKAKADTAKLESEKAMTDSENATIAANKALTQIEGAQEQIDKVEGLENKIKEIEPQIGAAKENAEKALKDSSESKHGVSIVYAINNLHLLDPQTLFQIRGNEGKFETIINVLNSLQIELSESGDYFESRFVKNCLGQLTIRIRSISLYRFINAERTELLNQFATQVDNALENYNQQQFEIIVAALNDLITNLRTEG